MLRIRVAIAVAGVAAAVPTLVMPPASADPTTGAVTVAGGGLGYGGPALSVKLQTGWPWTHAGVDPTTGDLLYPDHGARVLRVPAGGGDATVIAGTSTASYSYSGDGGPATAAQLQGPLAVAADAVGNVFVAEGFHVRKITPDGIISTIAGNGTAASTATGVAATSTGVSPTSIAAYPDGRVVIGEPHQVRLVGLDGTITQLAPDGTFYSVSSVALAPDGAVLVGDSGKHVVVRIAPGGSPVTVAGNNSTGGSLADGIAATTAPLADPHGLGVAPDGSVYVTDADNGRVRHFTIGGTISTVIDDNSNSQFCERDLVLPPSGEGAVLCSPIGNNTNSMRVLHFSASSGLGTPWLGAAPGATVSPDGAVAADAYLDDVRGTATDTLGHTWFTGGGLVRFIGDDGRLHTATTPQTGPHAPTRLAPAGPDSVYVADPATNEVWKVASDGSATVVAGNGSTSYGADGPSATAVGLSAPDGVASAPDGTLYIADTGAGSVRAVDTTTGAIRTVLTGAASVTDVAVASDGTVGVTTDLNLLEVSPDGDVRSVTDWGSWTTLVSDGAAGWIVARPWGAADLQPDGSVHPVIELAGETAAQVSRSSEGALLFAANRMVKRVATPSIGAVQVPPSNFTATPGAGRITLTWTNADWYDDTELRMVRGDTPPHNIFQGHAVSGVNSWGVTLFRDENGDPIPAGADFSFSAFTHSYDMVGPNTVDTAWSVASSATAAALPDTTPPQPVSNFFGDAGHNNITLNWTNPNDDDLLTPVTVRMAQGTTTPPATPTDGEALPVLYGSQVAPDVSTMLPDTDYAFSIFTIDVQGNYGPPVTFSGRLDRTPTAPATGVTAQASYNDSTITWTNPADSDLAWPVESIAIGNNTPPPPSDQLCSYASRTNATPATIRGFGGLAMDTDYTAAVYECDIHGNTSEAASVHFHTLLDAVPPGAVTHVTTTSGNHQFTVSFTPPTDSDFQTVLVRYREGTSYPDSPTSGSSIATNLATTPNSRWGLNLPGGRTYAVTLWAKDIHGNYSDPVHTTATTLPDTTPPPQPTITSTSSPGSRTIYLCYSIPTTPDLAGAYIDVTDEQLPSSPQDGLVVDLAGSKRCTSVPVPTNDHYYSLSVWPYDTTGNVGDFGTTQAMAHALPSQVPSLVPGVVANPTPTDNQIHVSWGTPASDGGSPITTYRVQVDWGVTGDTGRRVVDYGPGVHEATLDALPGGTDLYVMLLAANQSNGWNNIVSGPAPIQAQARDVTAPAVSSTVTASATGDGVAKLAWSKSTSVDVERYILVRTLGTTPASSPSGGKVVQDAALRSATSAGLSSGTTYTFTVFARDWAGHVSKGRSVRAVGTTLSPSAPAKLRKGAGGAITGVLRRADTRSVLTSKSIRLCNRRHGTATWHCAAVTTTDKFGHFRFTVKPVATWDYRIRFAGQGAYLSSAVVRTIAVT